MDFKQILGSTRKRYGQPPMAMGGQRRKKSEKIKHHSPPPRPPPSSVASSSVLDVTYAIPGIRFERKAWFDEILPSLKSWGQNILFLGQSNMGKTYFLKQLLNEVKPDRIIVISNTSGDQCRLPNLKSFQHYSTMPESIEEMDLQPHTYVIIDDIRVMALKHGKQRETLYEFFTIYSHHHQLNVFFSLKVLTISRT